MTSFDTDASHRNPSQSLQVWLWVSGLAAVVLGFVAMLFPFAATIAAELLFGAVLVATGVIEIIGALLSKGSRNIGWTLLFGALALIAGGILLFYPLQGVLTLTLVLASFFIVGGFFKMTAAWYLRPSNLAMLGFPVTGGYGWLAFSGALSVFLGVVLLLGLPGTAIWALGLLLGIDLIFLGASEIALALAIQRAG